MRKTGLIVALAALVVSTARAGDPNAPIDYPRDWGPDLCLGETGAKVVETSSCATTPEALIDGYANEGHHWEPSWSRGLPASFTLRLPRSERLNKLVFTTRTSSDGWPRECELWTGRTLAELHCDRQLTFPQKNVQVADFEAVEAQFVKVVVKSTWKDEETEIGEVALFFHGATPPKGGDARDAVELRGGDRLLGELVDASWTLRARFGDLPVVRADLVGASLSDEGDRVFLRTGEILGGELALSSLKLKLDSGQSLELARSKVASFATRKGTQEFPARNDELLARGAVLSVGEGERWVGKLDLPSLAVQTAVGALALPLETIQSVELGQGGEPLDHVVLRNGDSFHGILVLDELPVKLALGPEVRLARSLVGRIALAPELDPALPAAPENQRLVLKTGDVLSGTLALDKLRIRTAYATIEVGLEQLDRVEAVEHGKLRAALRDGSFLVGYAVPEVLVLHLDGGAKARVPVDRLQALENWRLAPDVLARVDGLVRKLDDASWPAREAAKGELVKLGKLVLPRVTRALRAGTAEAKKNAAEILTALRESGSLEVRRDEK